MRCHALATDYDGTLAQDGAVALDTRRALERLRASGRKLVLVTGRQFEDLVSNALPVVRARVDLVTRGSNVAGVCEIVEALLADELARLGWRG